MTLTGVLHCLAVSHQVLLSHIVPCCLTLYARCHAAYALSHAVSRCHALSHALSRANSHQLILCCLSALLELVPTSRLCRLPLLIHFALQLDSVFYFLLKSWPSLLRSSSNSSPICPPGLCTFSLGITGKQGLGNLLHCPAADIFKLYKVNICTKQQQLDFMSPHVFILSSFTQHPTHLSAEAAVTHMPISPDTLSLFLPCTVRLYSLPTFSLLPFHSTLPFHFLFSLFF